MVSGKWQNFSLAEILVHKLQADSLIKKKKKKLQANSKFDGFWFNLHIKENPNKFQLGFKKTTTTKP